MASATIKIAMKISIIIINQLNLGGGKTTEDITQANDENHKKKKKGATLGEWGANMSPLCKTRA